MGDIALSLQNVNKSFDGQSALKRASLELRWGELHALLGENGAGKSTLMNVVCGLYTADDGNVLINGQEASITSPADASNYGIGMVHQHFKLIGPFSVAENLMLSCGRKLGLKSITDVGKLALETAQKLGFNIDISARTDNLSVAERQRIEIIKLTLLGADIMILDEPTAVLTDDESLTVLSLLQDMADQGRAVVLITHRLREVTQYADRVTVMRAGQTVLAGANAKTMKRGHLAKTMVGKSVSFDMVEELPKEDPDASIRLELKNLCLSRGSGATAIYQLNLKVRSGEILGIAGVGGNGQTELTEAIIGLDDRITGQILIDGKDVTNLSIGHRRQVGLRLVPADRFAYALLAEFRAYENLALTDISNNRYGNFWRLSREGMRQNAKQVFSERRITGGGPTTRTRLLSGGNAQKLLLARELNQDASVLVAHSPTRGLDVRAYQAVHESILEAARSGTACLLISEDLDEVLRLSTRIAVISRGEIHGPFSANKINRSRIGEFMAGHA
jgi:simple sugar transport system ATP-binding protein